jgi:hypothetical protein
VPCIRYTYEINIETGRTKASGPYPEAFVVAGMQGFEPRFYGPEPHVLPLDDIPDKLVNIVSFITTVKRFYEFDTNHPVFAQKAITFCLSF